VLGLILDFIIVSQVQNSSCLDQMILSKTVLRHKRLLVFASAREW